MTQSVTQSRFALQIIIALLMLAGANVLIARMTRNSVPRQLLRQIDSHRDATLLASGNSLMAAAFDEDLFLGAWNASPPPVSTEIKPLNIALGASRTVEQLLLLRHAFSENSKANVVVYGFFDTQLTEIPTGGWSDLTGNRAMSYYVEPYFAADLYAPKSRLELIQMGVIGHVPMLVERLTLWAKVEKMRRRLEEIGMPHAKTSEFGRASDFKAMETDLVDFKSICRGVVNQNLPLAPSVDQMVEATSARHAKFVFVEMPMNTAHRTVYYSTAEWHAYEQHLRAISDAAGALFINASDWLPDDHFADDLHANEDGRIDFSKRLAAVLKPEIRNRGL
jgi:hypothetical protein